MGSSEGSHRLRVVMFSTTSQEVATFKDELKSIPDAEYLDVCFVSCRLDTDTATIASGARVVSLSATDYADSDMLTLLHHLGVKLIALRYAGASSVDVEKAAQLGIVVTRTPAHAYDSIAEYTVALMLCVSKKVHIGSDRVRHGNFSLEGLVGIDLANSTVGIVGTGDIGCRVAHILRGFRCKILAYDVLRSHEIENLGISYVNLNTILSSSDILTLHAPVFHDMHHLVGADMLSKCKVGVYIISTSVGGLIDVRAAIDALGSGKVGGLAMDIFEGGAKLISGDCKGRQLDEDIELLRSMPNVLITRNQSMLTKDAVEEVARATVKTLLQFRVGQELKHEVRRSHVFHT